jgi:hypothetical protein
MPLHLTCQDIDESRSRGVRRTRQSPVRLRLCPRPPKRPKGPTPRPAVPRSTAAPQHRAWQFSARKEKKKKALSVSQPPGRASEMRSASADDANRARAVVVQCARRPVYSPTGSSLRRSATLFSFVPSLRYRALVLLLFEGRLGPSAEASSMAWDPPLVVILCRR